MLLITRENQRQMVARCCDLAGRAGVRRGMPMAQARALFEVPPDTQPHDPRADLVALRRLAVWAERLAPGVAIDDATDEPEALLLDVSGCEQVWRGEHNLVRTTLQSMHGLGLGVRVAIAPTFGCAWAVAHFATGPSTIVGMHEIRAVLAPLPIEALRPEPGVAERLAEVGIERIGDVLDLPRATLPARFGHHLVLRLDQALGQAIEVIRPVRPVPPPIVERVFDGPTGQTEAIEQTTLDLLHALCGQLLERGAGVRTLEVMLLRSDLEPLPIRVVLGRPSRDAARLWTLVRPRLERAHLGFGVEGIRVRAVSVSPIEHEQSQWTATEHAVDPSLGHELVDTLVNRLGIDRVLRVSVVESHRPEHASRLVRAADEPDPAPGEIAEADRPTLLLDPPEPVEVMALTPDGPVHRVRWRGEDRAIDGCVGPERIGGEWWRARGVTRDYFKVRTETGLWLWVARAVESGRWFVHGVWG